MDTDQEATESYNIVTQGIPDLFSKFITPYSLKSVLLPLVLGSGLAAGAYFGLNYFGDEKVSVNELEGKTYVTVSQKGLFSTTRTDMQKDGKIGKTLDHLEEEEIEDENGTYQIQIDRVNNRLDDVMRNTEDEARKLWNASKPQPVIEETIYNKNLQESREKRQTIQGGVKK